MSLGVHMAQWTSIKLEISLAALVSKQSKKKGEVQRLAQTNKKINKETKETLN